MCVSSLDDAQDPAAKSLGPLDQLARIPRVRPDQLEAVETLLELGQHQLRPVPILNISRVHHYRQQQPQGIHHQMAFASGHFLARVVAPKPPFSVVLTVWLSMIAALGVGSRSASSRTRSRSLVMTG